MSYSAAMYHTGKNPLRPVKRDSADVPIVKSPEQRALHKAFLRYHDPKNWALLRKALLRMGRKDLIGGAPHHLVPYESFEERAGHANQNTTPRGAPAARPDRRFSTQHSGLPKFDAPKPAPRTQTKAAHARKHGGRGGPGR